MRPVVRPLLATLLLALACRTATPIVYQVEPAPRPAVGCDGQPDECADAVEVTYLGVSGFLIRWRGATILAAPSFSNPPLDRVAPSFFRLFRRAAPAIEPDTLAIERLLPPEADAASVILVGHGHYDHLLDVPHVAARRATRATVYGGPSVRHMLMGDPRLRADGRLVAILPDEAGTHERAGRWFYAPDSAFRFMALAADHAPTISIFGRGYGPLFASGAVAHDLDTLPKRASDWKLGEPYAYVIELLGRGGGGGAPAFRIYFQDAPNTPPLGFPPPDARRADLALLCAATSENVPHAPDSLVRVIQPRYALVGHWESFFRQQTLPLHLNPASDLDAFFGKLAAAMPARSGWLMPTPRTTVRICVCR
jgi:hypothetical protein